MRKALITVAVGVMVVFAFGCAQTDYPCITDNPQANASYNNNNSDGTHPETFINTNGKAHIIEAFRFAATFADGTVSEHLNFVDQKAPSNGVVSSSMYNYEHTHFISALPSVFDIFHGDTYCNPDWTGCSSLTNTNNAFCNDGSGKGGLTINASCPGTSRLIILVGDSIRDAECGRSGVDDGLPQLGGLSMLDLLSMVAENSIAGEAWNEMTLQPGITLSYENGNVYDLLMPAAGVPAKVGLGDGFQLQVVFDLTDPEFANVLYDLQNIADSNTGEYFTVTAEIFGRTLDSGSRFRLIDSELAPGHYSDMAARLFGS